MSKSDLPRPTDSELSILRVLWRRGPSTVREVLEEMAPGTGYTTVLKFLQIMAEKGLVRRDESRRTHVYRPAASREETQRKLTGDLIKRAFNGSAKSLVLQALSGTKASAEDLAEIRRLLDEIETKKAKR